MRLVFDTNIVISGLLWTGSPSRLIDRAFEVSASLHTSEKLLAEFANSLRKPAIDKQLIRLDLAPGDIALKYRMMCALALPSEPASIAPDPDDDWVIATALAAKADLIVTGDKPLLGVKSVGSIRIVGVAEALDLLGAG